jgi:hypothetical protein
LYSWHKPFIPGYTGHSITTTSKVAADPAKRSSDVRFGAIESCTRKYMFVDGAMRIVLVVLRAIYGSQVVQYLITDDGLLVPITALTGDEGALDR